MPATDEETLDRRFQEQFAANPRRSLVNVLGDMVPQEISRCLVPNWTLARGTSESRSARRARRRLLCLLKNLPLASPACVPSASHRYTGRRANGPDRSAHDGVEDSPGTIFRGRGDRRRWSLRRLQSAHVLGHRHPPPVAPPPGRHNHRNRRSAGRFIRR